MEDLFSLCALVLSVFAVGMALHAKRTARLADENARHAVRGAGQARKESLKALTRATQRRDA